MQEEWTVATLKEYIESKFRTQREINQITQTAAEKAIAKAEAAVTSRLESLNEFRGALSDAARLQMPRSEYQVQHTALSDRVTQISDRLASLESAGRGKQEGIANIGMVVALAFAGITSLLNLVVFFLHFK